jgi:hypothetical protein
MPSAASIGTKAIAIPGVEVRHPVRVGIPLMFEEGREVVVANVSQPNFGDTHER